MKPGKPNKDKMEKTYANISSQECLDISFKIVDEAEAHWTAAKESASKGRYGLAISTHIASTEEMIKALILFLDGNGFEFRKVNRMAIFRTHNLRYLLAYVMFLMHIMGEELKKYILLLREDPQLVIEFVKSLNKDDPDTTKKMERYVVRILVLVRKEFQWFQELDLRRQSGIYSDYKGKLSLPSTLSKEKSDEVSSRLKSVRSIILALMTWGMSGSRESKVYMEKTKLEFKRKNRYAEIEKWLTSLKSYKFDPFAAIMASINGENQNSSH